jgi:hypothetical protein
MLYIFKSVYTGLHMELGALLAFEKAIYPSSHLSTSCPGTFFDLCALDLAVKSNGGQTSQHLNETGVKDSFRMRMSCS